MHDIHLVLSAVFVLLSHSPSVQAFTVTSDTVVGVLGVVFVIFTVIFIPGSPRKFTFATPSGVKTGVYTEIGIPEANTTISLSF